MAAQTTNGGVDVNQQQPPAMQQQQWMNHPSHQHQQWMAPMQYPVMTQHQMMMMMMYPQQYMAPYNPHQLPFHPHYQMQQQQQQSLFRAQGSAEENKTIWVGDLLVWMDESYLFSCFAVTGQVASVKIIRNKQTGQSEGYGFVQFMTHVAAEKTLQSYNGTLMPNTDQAFRLNWATFSTGEKKTDAVTDLSIFVGDLAPDVTDALLQETFASKYPSVKGAKVVIDQNTGRSKGYGFVRFGDENERSKAMTEMNGTYCSSRPMRIGVATPKKLLGTPQQYSSQAVIVAGGASANGVRFSHSDNDSTNTTIFVGGVDSDITDQDLRQTFSQFGEINSVKIPVGKGCAFVQFANRNNAEDAIENLNGTVIGKHTVRLSWGRTPASRQLRMDAGKQWNGAGHGNVSCSQNNGYASNPSQDSNANASGITANGHQQQPAS